MKKFLLTLLMIPLVGCFEANDESGIKNTFCKDVPVERYQQYIGIRAKLGGSSRDSAAIYFKKQAIRNNHTCLQELDDEEAGMILLGLLGIMAISNH
ncbi:MAG: hypothetical protein WC358_08040 [Ignavibacteria bacterium]|jgi:hypothetical protein